MSTSDLFSEERLTVGDLIAEISAAAPQVGPNPSVWSGLTLYRFTSPMVPQWDQVRSLAVCFVAQGRKRSTAVSTITTIRSAIWCSPAGSGSRPTSSKPGRFL